jgi:hypothetical protein
VALADRLEAGPPSVIHGTPCSVGTTLSALAAKERAALQRMLDDRTWTEGMIFEALTDEGITVGRQSIGRHRRRGCRCSA